MTTRSDSPHARTAAPDRLATASLPAVVSDVLETTPFVDVHTHLFPPAFGGLGLWGIDHLLTYHYLEAELFRSRFLRPDAYWALTTPARADLIWQTLFVDQTPISEATRGVVAVLQALGLDPVVPTLAPLREFFAAQSLSSYVPRVFQLAGISEVVMTNDPLDPDESPYWDRGTPTRGAFHAALRLDRVLNDWPVSWRALSRKGYDVDAAWSGASVPALRRFFADCVEKMRPLYMAVSLSDTFAYPDDTLRTRLLREAVLPACRDADIPLALMIGVRRQVNPALRLAGDGVGKADLSAVERICVEWPDNRFLCTVLSRENQHELCVYARKFSNLLPFGCWWFLNNPSIVEEMTRERLEMLGASFIPQHSDARVLEQVIYKWRNTRRTLAPILSSTYQHLAEDGRPVSRQDIERDVRRLFRTNLERFTPLGAGA
jgi:hypothetical protein